MEQNIKNNQTLLIAWIWLTFFLVVIIIGVFVFTRPAGRTKKVEYVYYNVPTYTTIYEIVYPDSVFRYTAVHHSPSRLSSYRGSNHLYSSTHDHRLWNDERPDYWLDEWNSGELDVSTTAPIRIISETVTYQKKKYKKN